MNTQVHLNDEGFSVYSKDKNVTFNFYRVVKKTHDDHMRKYSVMDSSLTEIKSFNSLNEAKNFARYCATAVCEYMNGQSKLSEKFTEEDLSERLNSIAYEFGLLENDSRFLFKKEHGIGPKVSYQALAATKGVHRDELDKTRYVIRWENINTNVIFSDREMALNSLNNYLSINDWEVYDYKFDANS